MVSGRHVCTEKGVSPPSIQTQALYRMLHLKFILQDAGSLRTFFKGVRLCQTIRQAFFLFVNSSRV